MNLVYKKVSKLKDNIKNAEMEIFGLMQTHCSDKVDGHGFCVGMHECPKSPLGYCVYDHVDDPRWDGCLYCHEPHERK